MSSQASPTSKVPSPQSPGQPTEASALRKIMWFGIVQIAGLVAVSIVAFYAFAAVFSSIASLGLGPNPTPAQVDAARQAPAHRVQISLGGGAQHRGIAKSPHQKGEKQIAFSLLRFLL